MFSRRINRRRNKMRKMTKKILTTVLLFNTCMSFAGTAHKISFDSPSGLAANKILQDADLNFPVIVPVPSAPVLSLSETRNAVIVTVCGLNFGEIGVGIELRNLKWLIKIFFPSKLSKLDYAMPMAETASKELALSSAPRSHPDNYLDATLAAALNNAGHTSYDILPFRWDRDVDHSDRTIIGFKNKLSEAYARAAEQNKPVYVIAHSWGSVLMHETLHRLEVEKSRVKIAKLITTGSPLMPRSKMMRVLMFIGISKEHFQRRIEKPDTVGEWINLWAKRDTISNEISTADANIRIDTDLDIYEARVKQLLNSPSLAKEAAKDLKAINDSKHFIYTSGFHYNIKSLNEQVDIDIMNSKILPLIVQ